MKYFNLLIALGTLTLLPSCLASKKAEAVNPNDVKPFSVSVMAAHEDANWEELSANGQFYLIRDSIVLKRMVVKNNATVDKNGNFLFQNDKLPDDVVTHLYTKMTYVPNSADKFGRMQFSVQHKDANFSFTFAPSKSDTAHTYVLDVPVDGIVTYGGESYTIVHGSGKATVGIIPKTLKEKGKRTIAPGSSIHD